jgi:N4-gp56 family major capsid protein
MAIQKYNTQAQRTAVLAGEIIAHAIPTEVLGNSMRQLKMPKNKSNTLVVRSWVPYGGTVGAPNQFVIDDAAHLTTEGVTPAADTIVARDVTFNIKQYMCLYAFTDVEYDLYEDDIPAAMKEQTGERMGLVREMVLYGALKACTNIFYAGGSGRASVVDRITVTLLQKIVRGLNASHAKPVSDVLSSSPDTKTQGIERAFVAYCHTDCESDIRALANFVSTVEYGTRKLLCDHELGTWQNIRFVLSPDLPPIVDAGAAVAATGNLSTSGTLSDVYPMIFMAKDAAAQMTLRGMEVMTPIFVPPTSNAADPGGQRGYVGSKFYYTAGILNDGWMAVAETTVASLA